MKCACGCNQDVKPGNTYINGHNKPTLGKSSKFKGVSFIERFGEKKANEISKKISITKIGDKNPAKRKDIREKISKNRKGKLVGDKNPNYWKGKNNPDQSNRMKLNNPLKQENVKEKIRKAILKRFADLGSVKIGINETNILDLIETIYNYSIKRQYQILGYAVDGYIKELNLVIEIDEYHHYTVNGVLRAKDIKRQKMIEEKLNCKFLRIRDNINVEELKNLVIC